MSADDNDKPPEQRKSAERRQEGRQKQNRLLGDTRSFHEGSFVFRERETAQEAFIVKTGTVKIYKSFHEEGDQPREVTLGTLGPGGMFGEMALIDDAPRMASARAVGGTLDVYVISRRQFNTQLENSNPFINKLLQILAANARVAAEKVK